MIPCSDPRAQYLAQKADIDAAVARVLNGTSYILGGEVQAFEREFAAYVGVRHAIGVNSGTDALILALRALDVAGGEVITTPLTAIATIAAIVAAGATPVVVDVRPDTLTLDPAAVARAVNPRTKAVVPVHLYGCPADMGAILDLARRHKLRVVEDCAQSAGARWNGQRTGALGDVGCFSFYPTKNLGAIGDGGAVVTNDDELADRMRRLRQYGWDDKRTAQEPGLNSRLDEVQAAILRVKLPRLDADNAQRRRLAGLYNAALADRGLLLPATPANAEHIFHLYVVRPSARAQLMADLERAGVRAGVHYPTPAHKEPGYAAKVRAPEPLPVAEAACARVLSLPMYPQLTEAGVAHVASAVRAAA